MKKTVAVFRNLTMNFDMFKTREEDKFTSADFVRVTEYVEVDFPERNAHEIAGLIAFQRQIKVDRLRKELEKLDPGFREFA